MTAIKIAVEPTLGHGLMSRKLRGRTPPPNIMSTSTTLVLSPHIDDGVLSLAGVIATHLSHGHRVVMATFATADPQGQLSRLARQVHRRWGDPVAPYAARRAEDRAAQASLGAVEVRHLGLLDAIYRSGQGGVQYQHFLELFQTPPAWDLEIREQLVAEMGQLAEELTPDLVLSPLGVGNNVDHRHVHEASHRVFARDFVVGLYEEQPYATGEYPSRVEAPVETARARSAFAPLKPVHVAFDWPTKAAAIACYASQLDELFGPDRIGLRKMHDYARRLGDGSQAVERYWLSQPGGSTQSAPRI